MDKLSNINLFDEDQFKNEERRGRDWPSVEDYKKRKEEVIEKYSPRFEDLIKENPYKFVGYDNDQVKEMSELFATFVFGIKMVYEKFEKKYREIDIEFGYESDSVLALRWKSGGNPEPTYLINPYFASKYKNFGKNYTVWGEAFGGAKSPKLEDVFELGGVEEAAHALFAHEKKKQGKMAIITGGQALVDELFSNDTEYRALFWKLSYSQRYKPQYVSDFKELINRVKEVRSGL